MQDGQWQRKELMFVDIKKANLNDRLTGAEVAFIAFLEGWFDPGRCGTFRRWLYG